MTFTKLRLKWGSGTSDTVTLRFGVLNTTEPYLVKVIAGLEPVTNTVTMSPKAEQGAGFQGRRPDDRQIVIQVQFQPDYLKGQTVEGLRRFLYPMMVPKLGGNVEVTLMNEAETEKWTTTGYASKMPTNPFSKDPEIQIVIDCTSPYWSGALYQMPSPSSQSGKLALTVTNPGDAPTGWEMVVGITAAKTNFEVFRSDNAAWVLLTYNFAIGDQITINTKMGSRELTLLRGGVTTNLLQYLSPNSTYFQLDGGVNILRPIYTEYTLRKLAFTPQYLGI